MKLKDCIKKESSSLDEIEIILDELRSKLNKYDLISNLQSAHTGVSQFINVDKPNGDDYTYAYIDVNYKGVIYPKKFPHYIMWRFEFFNYNNNLYIYPGVYLFANYLAEQFVNIIDGKDTVNYIKCINDKISKETIDHERRNLIHQLKIDMEDWKDLYLLENDLLIYK